jgi:hypothetical protein
MSILGKVAKGLDRVTGSASTKFAVNALISRYGKLTSLSIDIRNGKVSATVELKGEASPLEIKIERYELIRNHSALSILIQEAASDREWLDTVLKDFVVGRSVKVPDSKKELVEEMLGTA